jgi:hypothetical protein
MSKALLVLAVRAARCPGGSSQPAMMHGKNDDERPFAVLHDSVTPQFPPCGLLFEDGFEIIVPWEIARLLYVKREFDARWKPTRGMTNELKDS